MKVKTQVMLLELKWCYMCKSIKFFIMCFLFFPSFVSVFQFIIGTSLTSNHWKLESKTCDCESGLWNTLASKLNVFSILLGEGNPARGISRTRKSYTEGRKTNSRSRSFQKVKGFACRQWCCQHKRCLNLLFPFRFITNMQILKTNRQGFEQGTALFTENTKMKCFSCLFLHFQLFFLPAYSGLTCSER